MLKIDGFEGVESGYEESVVGEEQVSLGVGSLEKVADTGMTVENHV